MAQKTDIVKFVVKHGAYDMVKGVVLWKKMEEKKVKQSKVNVTTEMCRNVSAIFIK